MQRDAVFIVRLPSLYNFLLPRMVDGDDPVPAKSEYKEVDHPVKTAKLYTFCLITPEL